MIDYAGLTLDELEDRVRADLEEVRDRYAALSRVQITWTPVPDRWSVGQCLQHLLVSDALYFERLERALAEGRSRGLTGKEPFSGGAFGRWFTRSLGPQGVKKFKSPRIFRPGDAPSVPPDVVEAFTGRCQRLLRILGEARGVDLDRIRVVSPVTGLMRLRVSDALRMLVAHGRRHLEQARRVTETPGFPAR